MAGDVGGVEGGSCNSYTAVQTMAEKLICYFAVITSYGAQEDTLLLGLLPFLLSLRDFTRYF